MKLTIGQKIKKENNITKKITLPKNVAIGQRIRALRHKSQASQEMIAAKLGISIPAFSKIETGITDINISRLIQIAALFKVRAETLLFDEDDTVRVKVEEYEGLKERLKDKGIEVLELQKKLINCYEGSRKEEAG